MGCRSPNISKKDFFLATISECDSIVVNFLGVSSSHNNSAIQTILASFENLDLGLKPFRPVSYTHLTLPTKA